MDLEDSGSLSARSISSLEDGSMSARSRKSKTLSRLRKLKKPAAEQHHRQPSTGFSPRPPGSEENNNGDDSQPPSGLLNGHAQPDPASDTLPSPLTAGDLPNEIAPSRRDGLSHDEQSQRRPDTFGDDLDPGGLKPLGASLFPSPLAPARPARRGLGGLEPIGPLRSLEPLDGSPGVAKYNSKKHGNGGDAWKREENDFLKANGNSNASLSHEGGMIIDGVVETETSDVLESDFTPHKNSVNGTESRKASGIDLENNTSSNSDLITYNMQNNSSKLLQDKSVTNVQENGLPETNDSGGHSLGQINSVSPSQDLTSNPPSRSAVVAKGALGTSVTIVDDIDEDSDDDLIMGGTQCNASAVEAENLSNSLKLERGIFQDSLATSENSNRNQSHGSQNISVSAAVASGRTVVGGNDEEREIKEDKNDEEEEEDEDEEQDDDESGNAANERDEENLKRYLAVKQKQIEEEEGIGSSTGSLPRAGRLSPITAASTPPPLPGNFASPALRTAYKRDDLEDSMATSEASEAVLSTGSPSEASRSMASTAMLLHTLTNKGARIRNKTYLSGGVRSVGSLVGKEELDSHVPGRKLRIFVATWNMHEDKEIPENLDDLLLPNDCEYIQDLYVIGTQESCPDISEWLIRLQETLGPSHVLLHSASHGVLNCAVFIRRDLVWFCSPVEESRVSTRPGSMIKTKGAMAVSFNFFGTSFIFIVSHFTSGDENMKERLLDYEKILKGISLPEKLPPTKKFNVLTSDVTTRFDCVFWCGDFNFRLAENKSRVEGWIEQLRNGNETDYQLLLQHDQLTKSMKKNEIFKGFREGKIDFLPTYKFDLGEDVYDTSTKARVPSYTDRVLFKSRKESDISINHYSCCDEIKTSDHRPVYALFEAVLRPGKDGTMTGGGMFNREVFIEGIKRRAAKSGLSKRNQSSSSVCSVM